MNNHYVSVADYGRRHDDPVVVQGFAVDKTKRDKVVSILTEEPTGPVESQQPQTVSVGGSGTGTSTASTSKEQSPPTKFKVGDKVRRISHANTDHNLGDVDVIVGISSPWPDGLRQLQFADGKVGAEEFYQLVPKTKFNVGDRVRRIHYADKNVAVGEVRTVVEVRKSLYSDEEVLKLDNGTQGSLAQNYELASEHKFKVGDRVRLNDGWCVPNYVGIEGVVEAVYDNGSVGYRVTKATSKTQWEQGRQRTASAFELDLLPPLPKIKLVGGPLHGEEKEVESISAEVKFETADACLNAIEHTYKHYSVNVYHYVKSELA